MGDGKWETKTTHTAARRVQVVRLVFDDFESRSTLADPRSQEAFVLSNALTSLVACDQGSVAQRT